MEWFVYIWTLFLEFWNERCADESPLYKPSGEWVIHD
jgi:hypothetical protein